MIEEIKSKGVELYNKIAQQYGAPCATYPTEWHK